MSHPLWLNTRRLSTKLYIINSLGPSLARLALGFCINVYNISHGNHVLLCTNTYTHAGAMPAELDDPCLRFFPFWQKFATPLCSRIFHVHKRTRAWHFLFREKYMHAKYKCPFCFVFLPLGIKADGLYVYCATLTLYVLETWQRKERSELSCSFRPTLKNCLALLFSSSAVTAVSEERYGFTCNKQWKRKISFMEFIPFCRRRGVSFASTLTSIVKGVE